MSLAADASKLEVAEEEEEEEEAWGIEKRREVPGTGLPVASTGGGGSGTSRRLRLSRLLAMVNRSSLPEGSCSDQYCLVW